MAVMRLHLVRHGPPAIDRATAASTWPLDPANLGEVDRLRAANVLPLFDTAWFSSTEPKAMETARHLVGQDDVEIVGLDGLREAARPAGWTSRDEFEAAVLQSMQEPAASARRGWETAESVRTRVLGALHGQVAPLAAEAGARDVVLVGHGTAWTVLVAALTGHQEDVDAWRSMRMPDHCALELTIGVDDASSTPPLASGRVIASWGSWDLG